MDIGPLVAPNGTSAVTCALSVTVKLVERVPLTQRWRREVRARDLNRCSRWSVIRREARNASRKKRVRYAGNGAIARRERDWPVVAVRGTSAVTWPNWTLVKDAVTLPKETFVNPSFRFAPEIVMLEFGAPAAGEKPLIVGAMRKLLPETPCLPVTGVNTLIGTERDSAERSRECRVVRGRRERILMPPKVTLLAPESFGRSRSRPFPLRRWSAKNCSPAPE